MRGRVSRRPAGTNRKGETHGAFCAKSGAALTQETGFCGSCGNPIGTAIQAASAPASQPTAAGSAAVAGSSGLPPNLAGALAYALGLVTGILFLVIEPYKNDRFVRFHAICVERKRGGPCGQSAFPAGAYVKADLKPRDTDDRFKVRRAANVVGHNLWITPATA